MKIQNLLEWLQEAEDNNFWMVSTQSVKRYLEKIQQTEQLRLGAITRWVACSERLPEITDNTMSDWVMTFDPVACRIDKSFYSKVTGWQAEHGEEMNVSHWMPLPEPPCA